MSILNDISEAMQKGKAKLVKQMVPQALEEGYSAKEILEEGLLAGMNIVGERFQNNEIFVPEVLIAARAMNAGTEILKPLLSGNDAEPLGRACMGTIKGDLYERGKNLVRIMLEGEGIEVIDLGVDVDADTFVQTAIEQHCDIIACSALLTTTMPVMEEVVRRASEAGIRDKVKIMVGGAPVTEKFCQSIGADCYKADAASAAAAAAQMLA